MTFDYILFDLDGTLTNSEEGIIKSLYYAFDFMEVTRPPYEVMHKFIGPPLRTSFSEIMHFDEEQTELAIKKYRERYVKTGLYENAPFDGIVDLLKEVKATGKKLAVATSKPEFMSKIVTDYFHLTEYFETVAGSCNEAEGKADVIRKVFERLSIPDSEKDRVLMIGDRKHDIVGAHECGIKCCGVYFGFAPEGELEEYHADYIADTVKDLKNFLLNN